MPGTVLGVRDMKMSKTQSQPSNASALREAWWGGDRQTGHRPVPLRLINGLRRVWRKRQGGTEGEPARGEQREREAEQGWAEWARPGGSEMMRWRGGSKDREICDGRDRLSHVSDSGEARVDSLAAQAHLGLNRCLQTRSF